MEVNAAPGFRMHVAPSEGTPRDVAGPVMDVLFPPSRPARIPIAAITGTNGKTTTTRMVAHLLRGSGHTVGMTTTDGVHIGGRLTVRGDMTGPTSARMVLRDPSPTAAVLETARGGDAARGAGVPTLRRRGGAQRLRRPPGGPRASTRLSSWRRSSVWWSRWLPTRRCSTPTTTCAWRWPTTPRPRPSATCRCPSTTRWSANTCAPVGARWYSRAASTAR